MLEPEWHALALRMAQQRLQRPDQSRLEDLRKLRSESDDSIHEDEIKEDTSRDLNSPEVSSIEVDDTDDESRPKIAKRSMSEESLEQLSPMTSPAR